MTKAKYPSEKLDQYMLRLPDGMRDRIKDAAAANNRSMNAEIVARLEASFTAPGGAVSVDAGGTHYAFKSYEEFTAVVMDAVSKANAKIASKSQISPSDDD